MSSYRTIHKTGRQEIIINKSKFIGTAMPVQSEEEALSFIDSMRREFRDANHNVYAYTIGENSGIQRYSDDGEPSGTAGMPVMNVIKLEDLRNVAVVVTRYFGGIKLGAGGLVRAYTKGAKIGIEDGIVVEKALFASVIARIDYTLLGKVENELSKKEYIIKDKIYESDVALSILCREEESENLITFINDVTSGRAEIEMGQAAYCSVKDGQLVE